MIAKEILVQLGLSNAESGVYIALLIVGQASLGQIIHQTNLRKSTVHESLTRLTEKGLVSFVSKKYRKFYTAAPPERLLQILEDKQKNLEILREKTNNFIEQSKELYSFAKPQAEAQVLVGIEGFKTMRNDVLKYANKEHLLLGAISRENEVLQGFFESWNNKRQKLKINLRILHKQSAKEKKMTDSKYMGKYFETRFLPSEVENPSVINIYGDRVVNVLWNQDNPICFMIINKDIAEGYRKYFEYLWKLSEK